MFFQFSPPTRPRTRKEPVNLEDEVSVISLAPFTTCPKILFEDIPLGVTATRKLCIKNPASVITNIHVAKVPEVPSGKITLSWLQTEINACGDVLLTVTWTPTEVGSCRNSLIITNNRLKLTREIFFIFRAVNIHKKKSPIRKGIRKTTKPTFGVSIKKIRKSLSPKKPKHTITSSKTKVSPNKRKTNYRTSNKENCPMTSDQFSFKVNITPEKRTVDYSLHCNILSPKNVPPITINDFSTFTVTKCENKYDTFLSDSLEQNGSTPDFAARLKSDSFMFSPHNRDLDSVMNRLQFTPLRPPTTFSYPIDPTPIDETFELPKPCLVLNNSLSPISKSTVHTNNVNSCNISTSTQISNYDANYSGREAKNVIEANLWTDSTFEISPKPKLSCIREESEYSDRCLKRKAETTRSTIPSKISLLDPSWNKVDILKLSQMSRERKCPSVKMFNPDLVINKLRRPDAFSATTTVDPFLSGNLYYDEEWMLKQELEFKRWLNALLTPPAELKCNANNMMKIDVAKLFTETRNKDITPAPSKEVVSSLYHTNARLNSLRQKAINLFNSPKFSTVLCKVFHVIEKKKIIISTDKNVHLDLTLQSEIIQILTCYNPLWLRIGLETVYGETIKMKSNMDVVSLITFIMLRFFADPFLKRKFGIVNVRRTFHPGYAPEIKKFMLKKYVTLLYFLDQAKQIKLIPHDPCLFCTNAPIKESKQLLLEFSKLLLSGVGDITKYFKTVDYVLSYQQNILDEFPYAINNLGKDLRDGIRLTKVMEIILRRNDLTMQMRAPAISRLQKVHNVKVALDALKAAGFNLTGNIEAKDIVDGHQEKTLSLLWQIIYKFRAPLFKEAALKIKYWWNSLRIVISRRIIARKRLEIKTNAAITIQRYYRSYLLTKQTQVQYQNIVRKICVIQSCFRGYIKMKKTRQEFLTLINAVRIVHRYIKAKKVRRNYLLTVDIIKRFQQRYRSLIVTRQTRRKFLELKHATITIQQRFRSKLLGRSTRFEYLKLKCAVISIQKRYRSNILMKQVRFNYIRTREAIIVIQNWWRVTQLARYQRKLYLENIFHLKRRNAANKIKTFIKSCIEMKKQRSNYLNTRRKIILIQSLIRKQLAQTHYRKLKQNTVILQQRFRANMTMKHQLQEFRMMKYHTIFIQSKWRAIRTRREFLKQRKAAITIQTNFRSYLLMKEQRESYRWVLTSTRMIQRRFRAMLAMKSQRNEFQKLKFYTIRIQAQWRMIQTRREFLKQRKACMTVQSYYRNYLVMKRQRECYRWILISVRIIQNKFRATLAMHQDRNSFLVLKSCVINIQRRFRATQQMKRDRYMYKKKLNAVYTLQKYWASYKQMKYCREMYLEMKEENRRKQTAASKIQALWRGYIVRKKQSQQLNAIRQRSIEAASQFQEENTVGFRFKCSVDSLFEERTTLKTLIEGLTMIDVLARICPTVCSPYLEPLFTRLFVVLDSSNQSEPFRQACTLCSTIILTIIEYRKLRQPFLELIKQDNAVTLIHLMGTWSDKKCTLFLNLSTIVWVMLQNNRIHNIFVNIPNVQLSLISIYKKVKRMQCMKTNLNSSFASKTFLTPTSKKSSTVANNSTRSSNIFLTPKSRRTTFKPKSPAITKKQDIFTDELTAITAILKSCNVKF